MYPQAETEALRKDNLDPERFSYEITSREIPMADDRAPKHTCGESSA
jgi:hypothetical protein